MSSDSGCPKRKKHCHSRPEKGSLREMLLSGILNEIKEQDSRFRGNDYFLDILNGRRLRKPRPKNFLGKVIIILQIMLLAELITVDNEPVRTGLMVGGS